MQGSVHSFNFIDIYVYINLLNNFSVDFTIVAYYVISSNRGDVWKSGNLLVKAFTSFVVICSFHAMRTLRERERPR